MIVFARGWPRSASRFQSYVLMSTTTLFRAVAALSPGRRAASRLRPIGDISPFRLSPPMAATALERTHLARSTSSATWSRRCIAPESRSSSMSSTTTLQKAKRTAPPFAFEDWRMENPALGLRRFQQRGSEPDHLGAAGYSSIALQRYWLARPWRIARSSTTEGRFHNKVMYLPLGVASQAVFAGLHGTVDRAQGPDSRREASHWLAVANGIAGLGFHFYKYCKAGKRLVKAPT
jgi:hypothetical protein